MRSNLDIEEALEPGQWMVLASWDNGDILEIIEHSLTKEEAIKQAREKAASRDDFAVFVQRCTDITRSADLHTIED